jgi:hypothetical protein
MATHTGHTSTLSRIGLNSIVAFGFGAVFVLVGVAGFTVSGGHSAAGHEGGELLGLFQVNVLHNVVHLAVGAVMLGAAVAGTRAARTTNILVGAVYLVLAVVGLLILGDNAANIIALNAADNGLHAVLGLALLGVGLAADRR